MKQKPTEWTEMCFNVVTKAVIYRRKKSDHASSQAEYKVKGQVFDRLGDAASWSESEGNAEMNAVVLQSCSRDTTFYVYDYKGGSLLDGGAYFATMTKADAVTLALTENDRMDFADKRPADKIQRRRDAYRDRIKTAMIEREKQKILAARKQAEEELAFKGIVGSW